MILKKIHQQEPRAHARADPHRRRDARRLFLLRQDVCDKQFCPHTRTHPAPRNRVVSHARRPGSDRPSRTGIGNTDSAPPSRYDHCEIRRPGGCGDCVERRNNGHGRRPGTTTAGTRPTSFPLFYFNFNILLQPAASVHERVGEVSRRCELLARLLAGMRMSVLAGICPGRTEGPPSPIHTRFEDADVRVSVGFSEPTSCQGR